MPTKKSFDAIIVGAGQAGPPLCARLTAAGMNVAFVERKFFGGTCVNTGCMPTKTLVASAHAAHVSRRAADFGVVITGSVSVDMQRIKERASHVTMRSRHKIESWLKGMDRCSVFEGHGRFESASTIRVGANVLSAPRIFINVGARARVPEMPGLKEIPYLTNTSILDVDSLPRHLVVIGGSYIGLEFAQIYRRFGSEVTVIEKGTRLISREDEDVSQCIKDILEREGIRVRLDAECIAFEKASSFHSPDASPSADIAVKLECEAGDKATIASHVLLAVGREPNTNDLDLDSAGVRMDTRGYITVDDQLRTNVAGIWALGDCNGRGAFTHTAYNDYEIVSANLLDGDPRKLSDRIESYALYIDPPLGRAGMTEREAHQSGRKLLIGTLPMARVGRAVERDETQGFMKIIVDADTKKILGASLLGIEADEAIHGILDMMYAGATATTLQRTVGIHPTVSELIPTVLGTLAPAAKH